MIKQLNANQMAFTVYLLTINYCLHLDHLLCSSILVFEPLVTYKQTMKQTEICKNKIE